ncbi:MAG: sugar-binding transcriptional regulator [Lachnospiraceae bacterium]|jgi:deoxyribonucleoside regulator
MGKKNNFDNDSLIYIAQLYYLEDKSQAEIAKIVGVSRPQVSKLLRKARESGIVTITVSNVSSRLAHYESILCQRYLLHCCKIVPECASPFETERSITHCALDLLNELFSEAKTIGIGWGAILNSICDLGSIKDTTEENSSVVPLIGSLNATDNGYNTNELVRKFGLILGMAPKYLYAPAFPQYQEEQAQFKETHNYRQISSLWDKLDASVFSINAYPDVPDLATSFRYGEELSINKAVGAVLSNFYNIHGQLISGERDYNISISQEQFMHTPIRIGIGANTTTPQSVIGALRTGAVTHLILPENMACEVLHLSGIVAL